jgi:hypothetical protein
MQVLNETLQSEGKDALYNANQLARRILNRTFRDGVSDVYIDEIGQRHVIQEVASFAGDDLHRQVRSNPFLSNSQSKLKWKFSDAGISYPVQGRQLPVDKNSKCFSDLARRRMATAE